MWPFKKHKRHLLYASIWEWKEKEGVPDNFIRHEDPVRRNRWITEYGELRQYLFEQHIKTLDTEEQLLFQEQHHPSQSHRFEQEARPYLDSLKIWLDDLGIAHDEVSLGFYHMDWLVLFVELKPGQQIDPSELPWLHRGFEIKFSDPAANKQSLPTAESTD